MSYAGNASHHASEIFDSFSGEDIKALRTDLETLGVAGWLKWTIENELEAIRYLEISPKQREKRKSWKEPILRRRHSLCAYRLAKLASTLLDGAYFLEAGSSYRDSCSSAAHLCSKIIQESEWKWPFCGKPPHGWKGRTPNIGQNYYTPLITMIPGQKIHVQPHSKGNDDNGEC